MSVLSVGDKIIGSANNIMVGYYVRLKEMLTFSKRMLKIKM